MKTHLAGIFMVIIAVTTAFIFTAINQIENQKILTETIKKNRMTKYVVTAQTRDHHNRQKYYYASNRGKSVFSDKINEARIYNTVAECMAVVTELNIQHPNFVINYDEININIIY